MYAEIPTLEPYFDGILDEQCNQYSECGALAPYVAAHKPAWDAEYTGTTASFCAADVSAKIATVIPLGRVGSPDEIAGPVLFLAGEHSTFITGEILNVNGGAVLVG